MRSPAPAAALLAACLLTPPAARGAGAEPFSSRPELADLPGRWSQIMELFDVPGAAVAAVKDGRIHVETFGIRDPETRAPVTAETMFYIASITKTYVAAGVCKLVEEGRLDLDDRVADHLPRFELPDDEIAASVTIRDLLCHRYGINSGPIVFLDAFTGEITEDRYYHWLSRGRVKGTVEYTNVHFTLLGKVIERVTGEDWRDFLDRSVFEPAGLHRTTGYASELYGDDDCATPTERAGDGWRAVDQRKTDRTMHAAGGLGTTALDAARWIRLNLEDGRLDGRRVLAAGLVREMRQPQSRYKKTQGSIRVMEGFGLGWQIGRYAGAAPLIAHGGGYAGTAAYIAALPEHRAGVVVLVNAGGFARGWGDIVAVDLMERLTGEAPPWSPYERFGEQVRKLKAEGEGPGGDEGGPPAALDAAALSRPAGLYAGWFRNPHLGTLIVEHEAGALRFRLGDAPLDPAPGARPDEFSLSGFEPPAQGRFVVTPGGEIDEVHLTDEDLGEFVFRR